MQADIASQAAESENSVVTIANVTIKTWVLFLFVHRLVSLRTSMCLMSQVNKRTKSATSKWVAAIENRLRVGTILQVCGMQGYHCELPFLETLQITETCSLSFFRQEHNLKKVRQLKA